MLAHEYPITPNGGFPVVGRWFHLQTHDNARTYCKRSHTPLTTKSTFNTPTPNIFLHMYILLDFITHVHVQLCRLQSGKSQHSVLELSTDTSFPRKQGNPFLLLFNNIHARALHGRHFLSFRLCYLYHGPLYS